MDARLPPILALVALLAVAGLAAASPPEETGWSPAGYGADGQDLGLADSSDLVGFATEDPGDQPGDQDLHFLTVGNGPLASHQDDEIFLTNEGTDHVAVSDDGTALAAAVDATDGPNLYFFQRSDADTGTENWTDEFPRGVTDVAITPDGDRVAVATSDQSEGAVRLIDTTGDSPEVLLEHESPGPIHAVDLGDEGRWVFAGGEQVVNGSATGAVLLFRETSNEPVDEATPEEQLPEPVRTVTLTPDSKLALAGSADGRLASFTRSGSSLSEPDVTDFDGSQVRAVEVRPDGGLVAAAATDGVHMLERVGSGPDLSVRWTAETSGPVSSLGSSRDLGHTVAAVPGPNGTVLAYHSSRAEPVWELPAGADHVDVDGDPRHLVASRDGNVSAYTFGRAVETGFPGPGESLEDAPSQVPSTSEGITAHVQVAVRNGGSLADTYNVTAEIAGDWDVELDRNQTQVLPNETATLDLSVTPGSVAAGRYNVTVRFASQSDPSVRSNLTVPVRVEGVADLRLSRSGPNASRPVDAGDRPTAFFTVENRGNKRTPISVFVRLTPSGTPTWTVDAPDSVGPLGPGEKTSFQIQVTVPEDAPDGAIRDVNVSVEGDGSRSARSLRYVVNPFRSVTLDVHPPTRFVNATVPGQFTATVENQGSVDTAFEFIFERRAHGTPGWTVQAQRDPFVVASGASRSLPITVVAPQNGVIDDRVLVKVQVVPQDLADQVDPDVQDNVTISAVFKDLPDPNDDEGPFEDVRDVPTLGAGAAAAALAAGAAAARRRGEGQGERGEGFPPRTSETYKNMQEGTEDQPSTGPPCRRSNPPGDNR